jgi:probable HAF family extracellular repeat protein
MVQSVVRVALFALIFPAHVAAQQTVSLQESVNIGHPEGAVDTLPFALNNHGTIVGAFLTEDQRSHAFVWTAGTGFEVIAEDALAWDVNDRGQVVGERYGAVTSGFLWTRRRGFTDLGDFLPYAINDAGVMAGVCASDVQPCIWKRGEITRLPDVQGWLWAINARGDAVGTTVEETAFLWTGRREFVELGGPGTAEAINDRGVVSGSLVENALRHPTVWTSKGVFSLEEGGSGQRVNNRGWLLVAATQPFVLDLRSRRRVALESSEGGALASFDMNERGVVVGNRVIADDVDVLIWRVRRPLERKKLR